jgi:hypothetical protein
MSYQGDDLLKRRLSQNFTYQSELTKVPQGTMQTERSPDHAARCVKVAQSQLVCPWREKQICPNPRGLTKTFVGDTHDRKIIGFNGSKARQNERIGTGNGKERDARWASNNSGTCIC